MFFIVIDSVGFSGIISRFLFQSSLAKGVPTFSDILNHYLNTGPKKESLKSFAADSDESSSEEDEAPKQKLVNGTAKPALKTKGKKQKKESSSEVCTKL